jgi:hypothetical protein
MQAQTAEPANKPVDANAASDLRAILWARRRNWGSLFLKHTRF